MKTPILLLHGALGSEKTMDGLKVHLGEKHEVYTLTFHGHGDTDQRDVLSFSDFVDQIKQFVDHENLEQVIIFGFSMGGYAGLLFAHSFPEKVKRVITLGTKFNWTPQIALKESKLLNPETLEEKVPRFAQYLQGLHGEKWKNLCGSTANLLLGLGDNPLLNETVLATLENPVNILLGEEDQMVSESESKKAAADLKRGTFTLLPGQPHPIEKVHLKNLISTLNSIIES